MNNPLDLLKKMSPLEMKELYDALVENQHLWTTTLPPVCNSHTCCGTIPPEKIPTTTFTPD